MSEVPLYMYDRGTPVRRRLGSVPHQKHQADARETPRSQDCVRPESPRHPFVQEEWSRPLFRQPSLCIQTAALRPPLLGSEERRRQNAHRSFGAPHADRCAEALHGPDGLRRPETRHGNCTVLPVLLLLAAFVDQKHAAVGREDVPPPLELARKTLHQGKRTAVELAHPPAGHDVPNKHLTRPGGAANDLCAVVAELCTGHHTRVPGQGALRVNDGLAVFILLKSSVLVHRAEAEALAVVLPQAENLPR